MKRCSVQAVRVDLVGAPRLWLSPVLREGCSLIVNAGTAGLLLRRLAQVGSGAVGVVGDDSQAVCCRVCEQGAHVRGVGGVKLLIDGEGGGPVLTGAEEIAVNLIS